MKRLYWASRATFFSFSRAKDKKSRCVFTLNTLAKEIPATCGLIIESQMRKVFFWSSVTYNVERRDIKYKISRPRVAIDVAADKDRLQTARQTSDTLKNGAAQRGKAQKKEKKKETI